MRKWTDSQLEGLNKSIRDALSEHREQASQSGLDVLLHAVVGDMVSGAARGICDMVVTEMNQWMKTCPPLKIVVNDLPEMEWGEITHPKLPDLVSLLKADMNVLLVGPAGSGKSYMAAQAAKALSIPFRGFVSCTNGTSESAFLGQLLPHDGGGFAYHSTPFVDTCSQGGLVCIDEVDAGDSNTLLVLNAALSGQPLFIPKRFSNPVQAIHKDARVVATANTFMLGSDRIFAGRNQLDGAFIDRWAVIEVGYDDNLEAKFCPDNDLRQRFLSIRHKIEEQRLRRHITGRTLQRAYRQRVQCSWDDDKILEHATLGWTKDEKKLVGLVA